MNFRLLSILSASWQPKTAPSSSVDSITTLSCDIEFRKAHSFLQWPPKSETLHSISIHQKLIHLLSLTESQSTVKDEKESAMAITPHSDHVHLPLEILETIGDALLSLKHYHAFFHFVTCSKSMLCYAVRNKHWFEKIQRYQIHAHLRQLEVMMGVPEHLHENDGYKEWIEEVPQIMSMNLLFNRWKAAHCKFGRQGSLRTRDSEMIRISRKMREPLQTPCLDEVAHLTNILEMNGSRMHQIMIYFKDTLLKPLFSRIELDFGDFDVDKELQCDAKFADSPLQWDHFSRRFCFYKILCNRFMLCIANNPKFNKLPLGDKLIIPFDSISLYFSPFKSAYYILKRTARGDDILVSLKGMARNLQHIKKATLYETRRDEEYVHFSGYIHVEKSVEFCDKKWSVEGTILEDEEMI